MVFAALGDSERLSAQVLDQVGRVMEGAVVAWTSGDTAVAVVDSAGVVTAVSEGTAAVTAAAGAASGTVAVTVAQVAGSVVVTPVADTVTLADTLRLAVKAFDANGHAVQRSAFLWSSSDPAVVTVDATGLVRGTAEGHGHDYRGVRGGFGDIRDHGGESGPGGAGGTVRGNGRTEMDHKLLLAHGCLA